jgi:hypothetical protein
MKRHRHRENERNIGKESQNLVEPRSFEDQVMRGFMHGHREPVSEQGAHAVGKDEEEKDFHGEAGLARRDAAPESASARQLQNPDGRGYGSRLAIDPKEVPNPGLLAKQTVTSLAVRLDAGLEFEPGAGPIQSLIGRTFSGPCPCHRLVVA